MDNDIEWIPDLVLLDDYSGDWEKYFEAVYSYFKADFIDGDVKFRGLKLNIKRHPESQGKSATFWHMISEGQNEENRLPDIRRCERIRWPCPIIDNGEQPSVKIWENVRKGERRVCLWVEEIDYLVILAVRNGYYVLWTAYCVIRQHQKDKLRREYLAWINADAAP